jgi:hypothetical protein
MLTYFKKIALTVLPLTGLLLMAPLTFAYDSRREQGRAYNEITQEHQQGHQALAAEARANGYYQSERAQRHEQRRLRREHQRLHRDPNAQHEDYHDGNRYPS